MSEEKEIGKSTPLKLPSCAVLDAATRLEQTPHLGVELVEAVPARLALSSISSTCRRVRKNTVTSKKAR